MDFKTFVFYALSTVLVVASMLVVTLRNPVHSALMLILAFFSAAGVWILLQAEFLAIALILVYVGAVMVLFLFVVMLLDINLDRLREGFWSYLPVGLVVGLVMAVEMGFLLVLQYGSQVLESNATQASANYSNVQEVGRILFTDYVYPFELASVVLLVGVIGAIALTLRGKRKSKSVDPSQQVFVKAKDRVRLVKMKAEVQE